MSRRALVILGDQLFPLKYLEVANTQLVFMAEDYSLCTHFKYHKIKIAFFLSCMRHYRKELEDSGRRVVYYSSDSKLFKKSYFEKLEAFIRKEKMEALLMFPIVDRPFAEAFQKFVQGAKIEVEWLPSPFFLTPEDVRKDYFSGRKRPFMKTFYELQRKRLNILMNKQGKPTGGKFSFDELNRKRLPKELEIVSPKIPDRDPITKKVIQIVEKEFAKHPGQLDDFWLPVTRKASLSWLNDFFKRRFKDFGPYEDAIDRQSDFVFHSALSPLINSGLLTPEEVVRKALEFANKKDKSVPIESVEGFVRQIIGWREFIYGIDQFHGKEQAKTNFFQHTAKLENCWYAGDTGIPPLDDVIRKTNRLAYAHHIERLMIVGNIMLLSRVAPNEAYRWFMEMFVDSADWVMGPNVYGMSQFSDGGIFATKPYICGSNYFLKMSHYKKGHWCDVLDGLYWSFIHDHKKFFEKQPRLRMILGSLDKMDSKRKRLIFTAAENFRSRTTR